MTYTYTIDTSLERGEHELSAQVNNVWKIVSSDAQKFIMSYDLSRHGIDLFQDERRINAWNIQLKDAPLPDLPSLTFSSDENIVGEVQAVVRERGLKFYKFRATYWTKAGGVYQYQSEAAELPILQERKDWLIPAGLSANVVPSLCSSLRVVGAEVMTGDISRQQNNSSTLLDILGQILTANYCAGEVRNGTLYITPLLVSSKVAEVAVSEQDTQVQVQGNNRVYNKVRTHYANAQYPVPNTAITEYDAGNWVGTISNVPTTTAEGLIAPSGAGLFLKANGAVSRSSLLGTLIDFDRFRLNWKPDAATSLAIKLEEDASNYLSLTHTFSGGYGEGFNVYGTSPSATAYIDITANRRIVSVEMKFTQPCSMRLILLDSAGVEQYRSPYSITYGNDNTIRLFVPASEYQARTAVTLRLEATGLYVVGTSYGVSCTSLLIDEYREATEWIPFDTPNDKIVSRTTLKGNPHAQGVTDTGPYTKTKYYRIDYGAVPQTSGSERVVISGFQKTMYVKGTYWDTPTTHNRVANFSIEPSITVENGHYVGYFSVTYTYNAGLGAPVGALFMYEWVYGHTFELALFVVDPLKGDSGTWGGTVFVTARWMRPSSYYAWDELDVPLSSFTKTGNPKTLIKVTLTATGINYYDALCLYASSPIPRIAEAGNGNALYDVGGIVFGGYSSAMAYAQGMLALLSSPAKQYTKSVGFNNDIALGEVVDTDGENTTVSTIMYTEADKSIICGRQVETMESLLRTLGRRLEAVEKVIL